MVVCMNYPVENGVAHEHIGGSMSILRKHPAAVRVFACPHVAEKFQILFHALLRHGLSVPGWVTVPRFSRISSCD